MSPPYHMPEKDEIHIWTAFLSACLPELAACESVLSAEEKQRAERFHRTEDRLRYVVAHGILRQLLGGYLSASPGGLAFTHNAHGKPALVHGSGHPVLSFNLAHSGDLIMFAIAVDRKVGIDIEAVRSDFDVLEMAQGQFSEREIAFLRAVTGRVERTEAFFRCWTRKEAYLKARGEGLGIPLKEFSVSFGLDEPAAILWSADDPLASEHWSVWDIATFAGYAGAVVCAGRPAGKILCQWNADRGLRS